MACVFNLGLEHSEILLNVFSIRQYLDVRVISSMLTDISGQYLGDDEPQEIKFGALLHQG